MTLKEVLQKTLEIIGEEINFNDSSDERLKKLISCGNMIYAELTEEYVTLQHSDEVRATNGRIPVTALSKPLKAVVRVKIGDKNIPYRQYYDHIRISAVAPSYTVIYSYHAPEAGLNDELILPPNFATSTIATGVASEYFYRSGLIEEALFYKNRFDNSLLNVTRKRNAATVVYRRFI